MEAPNNKDACKKLLEACSASNQLPQNIALGYKATATMMMAKHVLSPVTKLSKFSSGRSILEKAVAMDTSSVEVRFLRYAVQVNAPSFLGYNKSIDTDEAFLRRNYKNVSDIALKKMVEGFLLSKK